MTAKKKIVWTRYFGRKFCSQRFEVVIRVFYSDFFRRHFHAQLYHNLVVPERGNHAIYYNEPEWNRFAQKVCAGTCKDLATFHRYMRLVKRRQVRYGKEAARLAHGNLARLSWHQLKRRYEAFDRLHCDFFVGPIWIPFITEPFITELAERELKRLLKKKHRLSRYSEYFDVLFSPEQKNAVVSEHEAMLRLAIKVLQTPIRHQSEIAALIRSHWRRYRFLPCYDINDAPWSSKYFEAELGTLMKRELSDLRNELNFSVKRFPYRRRAFRTMLRELRPPKHQREIFVMAHEMVFIKDQRDDYRRLGSHNIQPLYHELARRAGVTIKDITHLLKAEMLAYLSTSQLPVSRAVLKSRARGYAIVRTYGEPMKIYHGAVVGKIIRAELGAQTKIKKRTIRGPIGSWGTATGAARVVCTKHDVRKVKRGDVMVAVTTHPDFVPAMRRCAAIVTDEGGITCHAAIVSRELKIPCIVGTKTATTVLTDGDRVEVDATKGVVKKI